MKESKVVGSLGSAAALLLVGIQSMAAETPSGGSAAMATAAETTLTVADGIYSSAQAERGEKIYSQKCASCHLVNLSGSNSAPALAGASFIGKWEHRTVRDLFSRMRTTMPGDNPGTLEEAETVDLIAFLLSKNNYPAGHEELKPDRHLLELTYIVTPVAVDHPLPAPK